MIFYYEKLYAMPVKPCVEAETRGNSAISAIRRNKSKEKNLIICGEKKIWDSWVFIGERKISFHFFLLLYVCGGECWIAARAVVAGVSGYKAINLQISIQHIRTRMVLCTRQAAGAQWESLKNYQYFPLLHNKQKCSFSISFRICNFIIRKIWLSGCWRLAVVCGRACDDDELGEFSVFCEKPPNDVKFCVEFAKTFPVF